MLFSYHLLYFCTALSLIIMLSSHYHHHKSKTFSQLTQCPFTGTLLLFEFSTRIVFIAVKYYLPTKRVQSPDHLNAGTSVFLFDYCPTCKESGKGDDPCVTNQSPCNICSSFSEEQQINIDVGMSGNRRHRIRVILARKMIWTYWVTMWRHFLALKQTLRVLLKIYSLHLPIPNPYVSNLYD